MLRRVLPVSVALAVLLPSASASAAQTKVPVGGDVQAIAFAGDALIVARQPQNGGLVLERLSPGAPAQMLLRLPRSRGEDDFDVMLAASPQAIALGIQLPGDSDPSVVFVGPATGALRQVAACAAGLLVPPVAVAGVNVAWLEGGCGEPPREPRAASPASIVVAGPDASAPQRRVALGEDALAVAITLDGQTGLVGVARPSFFSFFRSEVRRLGTNELGETIARESARLVVPVGVLSNGESVLLRSALEEGDGDESGSSCDATLFVIASATGERRALPLGGCPEDEDFTSSTARVAGDRVYSLVTGRPTSNSRVPRAVAITSVRGDGGDARLLARGTHRPPLGIAAVDPGRVAWYQRRCVRGSEIVIDDGAVPASAPSIRSCVVRLLTRSARVRGGRITLRLRCPSGCSGQLIAATRRGEPAERSFAFARGTHRLSLRLKPSQRRAKRLRVALEVANGPSRSATIRLR